MLSLVSTSSRRLLALLTSALLALGVLVAAPPANAATTLTYNGWSEIFSDGDLWISFTVGGDEASGTMTASVAGKTVALEAVAGSKPQQYAGSLRGPFPTGTLTVTGKLVAGGTTVTGTGRVAVLPARRYAAVGSSLTWGADPLRAAVVAEGGTVTPSAGAVVDPSDPAKVRYPLTDLVKGVGHVQTGGTVRYASPRRDVTLSDVSWIRSGDGGSLRADATYRHPGQPARTERGVVIATAPVIYGGGDHLSFFSSVELAATSAGSRVLGVPAKAALGTARWQVTLAEQPQAVGGRLTLSPARTTYGRQSRVTVAMTRGGTYAGGSVTFRAGSRALGTVRLSRGGAAVTVPAGLAVGTHAITASYKADYSPTTAAARASLRITKASTVTKARLAKKTVTRTQRAKLTATVTPRGTSLRPTGRVTVFDGKKRLVNATLTVSKRGRVTVRLPKLKKRGKHVIRVVYAGSSSYGGSRAKVVLRVR
ncbi:Ig-like domain repeat protein [Mumia quercus]|uniref:Ig-like domain repeat protein n=1 Tax=Mumia quercus TaxID=2976125 RepID=UPI0021D29825|nr:Ig-like domain repeat protein [Mumia quercus]